MQLIGSFSSRKCCPIRGKPFLGWVLIWALFPLREKKIRVRGEKCLERAGAAAITELFHPSAEQLFPGNALDLAAQGCWV